MQQVLLYGIFPVVIAGGVVSWQYGRFRKKPLESLRQAYQGGDIDIVLKDVYRFKNVFEVREINDAGVNHVRLPCTATNKRQVLIDIK
jgi:hypothetical protein